MTERRSSLDRVADRLSLERPDVRSAATLALVVLTLVSPYLQLPDTLPAVRLEQLFLVVLIAPLITFHIRHPERRSLGIVDFAFFALAASTLLTILLTPLFVSTASRSPRDAFELAWIAQLWIVYRLARTVPSPDASGRTLAVVLGVAAIAFAALAVLQFVDPPGFNDLITSVWTQAHNLAGVEREGRAVGTAGNANQFGILGAILLVTALAALVGGTDDPVRPAILRLAIGGAMVALVLSQSRGALLAAAVALGVGLGLALARRQTRAALARGLPPVLLGAAVAFGLMLVAPPESGTVLRRFDPIAILRDPSVIIRLGRLQAVLGGSDQPDVGAGPDCVGSLVPSSPAPGHEPGAAGPPSPAGASASDVAQLARAIAAHYCRTGAWPDPDLSSSLVPTDIARIPNDPSTGAPYDFYATDRGFAVGPDARTDASTVAGEEAFGSGSLPDLLMNPSFESGATVPTGWIYTPGVLLQRSGEVGAAFGGSVGRARIPRGGAVYQLVVADLPMSTEYLAGVWVRSAADVNVQLYVVAIEATGRRIDPLAAVTLPVKGGSGYQHLLLPLRTPDAHLTSLQVMVRSPDASIEVDLDGATLTESRIVRSFGSLVEGSAGATSDAVLRESPVLGLGPQKDSRGAAYDNEYLSFLVHYGILGLVAYLLLFLAALVEGVRVARRDRGWVGVLGVALVSSTVALGVFAISAGAYRQLQVMVVFWVIAGLVVAGRAVGAVRPR